MRQPDGFQVWEETVPESIRGDALWRMTVYRLALFLGDLSWEDVTTLHRDGRTRRIADQLYRSVGSISANIAEGYSRGSGKDRARFYEYALGSAREARDWYYKARHKLGVDVTAERLDLLAEICRQLLGTIRNQPGRTLREPGVSYTTDGEA
ncbi:four helix bundle protein [Rubrivirga sp.]|uniref:four helix bundle protein n=1 Tax=Rubrivirga sp. TaxID=1885344 RepID=UPI003B516896